MSIALFFFKYVTSIWIILLPWALRQFLVKKDAKVVIKAGGKMSFLKRFMRCALYIIQNKIGK